MEIRPLYNVVYVAYFELNIDYIIENYCVNKEKPQLQCHGKCHLATQLAVNTSNSSTDSYLSSIFEAFVPVYFQEYKLDFSFRESQVTVKNNWAYHLKFNKVYINRLDYPPQV